MNTQHIPIELIDANPWQTRTEETPEHIEQIAESIRHSRKQDIGEHGLWTPLMARQATGSDGRYQIPFGMTRLAAFKLANPNVKEFPLDIVELTDVQMSDLAAEENARRKNLSAIETARAIERRIKDFGMTQMDAAAPFGYKDQSSVSNLLRLLKLPAPIQAHVHSGELSERVARRLISVARVAPNEVVKVAEQAMKEEPGEREAAVLDRFDDILHKKGKSLDGVAWDLKWPKAPMSAENVRDPAKDEPAEVPACIGCENFVEADYSRYCTFAACYQLKTRLFARSEAARISQKTGIAIGASSPDAAGVHLFFGGDYESREFVPRVMKLKRAAPLLFLVPIEDGTQDTFETTGSRVVQLGTTDLKALKKLARAKPRRNEADEDEDEERVPAGESESARHEREMRLRQKRFRASSRVQQENERLLAAATKVLGPAIEKGGLLDLLTDMAMEPDFEGHLGIAGKHVWGERRSKKIGDARAKQFLVMGWILSEHSTASVATESKIRKLIENTARELKIRLPKNWDSLDETPYLHEGNCWNCGCETNEYSRAITQADLERGWTVLGDLEEPEMVLCPECAVRTNNGQDLEKPKGKKAQ